MEIRIDYPGFGFTYFTMEPKEQEALHSHNHYQISIPITAESQIQLNQTTHSVQPFQSILAMPGESHRHASIKEETAILLLSVYHTPLKRAFQEMNLDIDSVLQKHTMIGNNAELFRFYQNLLSSISAHAAFPFQDEEKEILLARLVAEGIMMGQSRGSYPPSGSWSTRDDMLKVKNYIDTHFRSPMTLEDLTEYSHISKYHLIRRFKEVTGFPPLQYLQAQRLQYARILLTSTKDGILEIALSSGFGSLSSFQRSFKQRYGCSPRAFRQTEANSKL
ncbi:helix-turn-helix domain-containing protein [Peribacillus kribbensis]|uniref:helix-turn-helix domain-containing protein n=1 Tax=Peribacillus kribbensis TaxID=356658 RepID=UPI000429D757|nr:helix-turn-helix domain-containing protein [Peribacillus kribbensis]